MKRFLRKSVFVWYDIDMTDAQQKVYTSLSDTILSVQINRPLLVAINGKDASGKTMMANILAEYLAKHTKRQIIRISIDDFMNERAVRYTPTESAGRSCYNYTFNFQDFIKYTLEPLKQSDGWSYKDKIFDHATDVKMISPDKLANHDAIVIIDGVFLYKHDLVKYWDVKILLEVEDTIVIDRGAQRDEARIGSYEEAKQKYIDRYISSQTIYFEEEKPERVADVVVNNNDISSPFIVQ
jgi:uridine kinase